MERNLNEKDNHFSRHNAKIHIVVNLFTLNVADASIVHRKDLCTKLLH
jgi:hypothetical protein